MAWSEAGRGVWGCGGLGWVWVGGRLKCGLSGLGVEFLAKQAEPEPAPNLLLQNPPTQLEMDFYHR